MNTLLVQSVRLRPFRIFSNRVCSRCYTVARKDENSPDDSVPSKLRDSRLYQFEERVLNLVRPMLLRFGRFVFNSRLIKRRSDSKGARKARLQVTAINLYHSVNDVNMREFFTVCRMPDTFQSFYTVHVLHFWMCLVRLSKEGDAGKVVSKTMGKIFAEDVKDRLGMLGPLAPRVSRQNRAILDDQFLSDILSYDEAIISHDIVLAAVMWRKFLSNSDAAKADPVLLALLVEYVRKQVHHLDHINSEQLLKTGKITWLPLSSDHYKIQ